MTGPSEAVEAARAALHDNAVPGCARGAECEVAHAYYLEVARVALNAAVPVLQAQERERTKAGIAAAIDDTRCLAAPDDEWAKGWIAGRDHGASVARSFEAT